MDGFTDDYDFTDPHQGVFALARELSERLVTHNGPAESRAASSDYESVLANARAAVESNRCQIDDEQRRENELRIAEGARYAAAFRLIKRASDLAERRSGECDDSAELHRRRLKEIDTLERQVQDEWRPSGIASGRGRLMQRRVGTLVIARALTETLHDLAEVHFFGQPAMLDYLRVHIPAPRVEEIGVVVYVPEEALTVCRAREAVQQR